VLLKRAPLKVTVDGKDLELEFAHSGPSRLEGRNGSLTVTIDYAYLRTHTALQWSVTLRNEGAKPLDGITVIPLLVPLDVDPSRSHPRVRHLTGSFHFDGVYPPRAFRLFEEQFVTHDHSKAVRIESHPTASAYDHSPVLQFAVGPDGNLAGLFVGFEWSSRWYLEAKWARYSWTGEPRPEFQIEGNVGLEKFRLEPGESLTLPKVHMGFWEGADWNAADNAVRGYVRDVLAARLQGRVPVPPVSYDHWFGIHQFFDVEDMKRQATRAAELGVEYFCLDAAWYPVEKSFADGIGNWYPDPKKFPNGIEELSEHVRQLGMGFGIWHMIERGMPGTQMVRKYPDLYYKEMYLRLERPEARAVALDLLRTWITRWKLTWMRWELSDPQNWTYEIDPSGKLNQRYMRGMYEVMDTIRREFPNVYIEGVAGGGTRMDWGMAVRTHGTWLSDHTAHPDVCRFMQTGASRFWPTHFLNLAIRAHRNSGDSEVTPHNLLSRMAGTMSFNGDIAQWSPQATRLAKNYVDAYKRIRSHLAGDPVVFPLPQPDNDREWDAVLFGGEGGRRLLFAFRLGGPDSIQIPAPPGRWTRLLGSDKAEIASEGGGATLRLEPNSSALWELTP
jgi:alpha-galactosidase